MAGKIELSRHIEDLHKYIDEMSSYIVAPSTEVVTCREQFKARVHRANTVRVSCLLFKQQCTVCRSHVYWFDVMWIDDVTDHAYDYQKNVFPTRYVCNDCASAAGIKHYLQSGTLTLWSDIKP